MFERIVVATDLSSASDRLIACLPGLQCLGAKQIILVHALGIRHLEEMKHLLTPMVEPRLQEQKQQVERMGFSASIVIMPGLPQFEIARSTADAGASLIVVGSHGATGAREVLLGGVAMKLLHEVTTPVLLFRLDAREEGDRERAEIARQRLITHVLHPTDFSDTAEHALDALKELVRAGAEKITLFHVQDDAHIGSRLRDKVQEFNRIDRSRLERIQAELKPLGLGEVVIEIACGSPTREIMGRVKATDVTLVLMGSQGRGFIKEVFLGSVSNNVARQSPVPLLLVPAVR